MQTICINARGYDNILLSFDEGQTRISIHSENGNLSTKMTPAQVQTLIDALTKINAEWTLL